MAELQFVVFYLNKELYGVDSSQVKQIIKYQDIKKSPEMPDYVEGLMNLRGDVVTVINLSKKFKYPQYEITNKTKIIISELEGKLFGFIVDDITELAKFNENEIEVLPDVIRFSGNTYLKKVAKKEDTIISILDLPEIVSKNDLIEVINKIEETSVTCEPQEVSESSEVSTKEEEKDQDSAKIKKSPRGKKTKNN